MVELQVIELLLGASAGMVGMYLMYDLLKQALDVKNEIAEIKQFLLKCPNCKKS